ncbi:MAG: FliH/SctL family protein [Planctomycetota bacterium]|nr:FliH/SctL family protein [Planctomycetota bacterium]
MSGTVTINLSKPVISVGILGEHPSSLVNEQVDAQDVAGQIHKENLEAQKAIFLQACQTLNGVVDKLNNFYDQVFVGHSEEIAKLSVEIARKILMHKVENGDYKIESIVKEALENSPDRQDVVVHLHPDDIAQCQRAQQDEPGSALVGVKLVSDSNIGRAECLLESPKGIVKSLIDENLERIARALENK